MLPNGVITAEPVVAEYLPPWDEPYDPLISYATGGTAVGDGSAGRHVQLWALQYEGGKLVVSDEAGVKGFELAVPGVLACSLAFDNNMGVVIAYQDAFGVHLYHYDTLAEEYSTLHIYDGTTCLCTIDDFRDVYNASSDVIFSYTRTDGGLYYRQQRDRYSVEYLVGPAGSASLTGLAKNLVNRLQWRLDPSMVVTPPGPVPPTVPANLRRTAYASASISLDWGDSTAFGATIVAYRLRRNGLVVYAGVTSAFTDTGLTGETTYSYTVEAEDSLGNLSGQSLALAASTADVTPPSTPANLRTTAVSYTSAILAWDAAADTGGAGLAGYRLRKAGTVVFTGTGLTFTATGLTPNVPVNFTVAAYDGDGNEGAQSSALAVTAQDVTAPSAVPSLSSSLVTATTCTLTWGAATDTGGSGLAGYRLFKAGVLWQTLGNVLTYAVTGQTGGSTVVFEVRAIDVAGNEGPGVTHSVTFAAAVTNTYRYWRLLFTANDGDGTYVSASLWRMFNSSGTDLAAGKSIGAGTAAESGSTGGDSADGLFDGTTSSGEWVLASSPTVGSPAWVAVDLGSVVSVPKYLVASQRVVTGRTPTAWKLQGNNTSLAAGAPWADVDVVAGSTGWGVQAQRYFGNADSNIGAHRYWRITNITVPSGLLEVSEIRLGREGAHQDAGSTMSSTPAPNFGALSVFQDDSTSTRGYWLSPPTNITWDMGTAKSITQFRQAGFDTSGRHISAAQLEYSDDASTWLVAGQINGGEAMPYPGNNTFGAFYDVA